jgi:hypothetical protein
MRTLGWIYLAGYALDAGLSAIASYAPGLVLASNLISTLMMLFTIVAFVLAVLGKLKPRKVFLALSGYYFFMLGFGFVLGVLLAVELGPQKLQGVDFNPQFLRQHYPWFEPVQLALLFVWTCLALYGLMSYGNSKGDSQQSVAPDSAGMM